jgi:hypothetical protein
MNTVRMIYILTRAWARASREEHGMKPKRHRGWYCVWGHGRYNGEADGKKPLGGISLLARAECISLCTG